MRLKLTEGNKVLKVGVKEYYKPTPKQLRKIGDAISAGAAVIATSTIITDHLWLAMTSVILGFVGKILTNYFSEEEVSNDNP